MIRTSLISLLSIAVTCIMAQASYAASGAVDELVYKTQQGDTLIGIGSQLSNPSDWKQIQRINHINNPKLILVGSTLHIPVTILRSEDAPATVISVEGNAQVNQQPLVAGALLTSGNEIVTGKDGFALIKLANGSKLAVQAGSHITLTALKKYTIDQTFDSTVNLQKGRIETEATKTNSASPRYRIITPSAVMSVRGTQFRVATDETKTSRTEVTDGLVRVADMSDNDSAAVGIAAGYGNIVDNGKPPTPPVALLPAPDVTTLTKLQERPVVRFDLTPVANAKRYRAQIATDAQFEKTLRDQLFDTTAIKFDGLGDGAYWMRVRAVDNIELEGINAQLAFV